MLVVFYIGARTMIGYGEFAGHLRAPGLGTPILGNGREVVIGVLFGISL